MQFVLLNVVMWLVMTVILIVLPDQLGRWVGLGGARAVGRQWQARMGALARFPLQVLLWASSALVAMWLSDLFRL